MVLLLQGQSDNSRKSSMSPVSGGGSVVARLTTRRPTSIASAAEGRRDEAAKLKV